MKKIYLMLILCIITNERISSQTFLSATNDTLPYRLFVPRNYNASVKYPLVLFLHGAGERGTDNNNQLNEWPKLFAQDTNQVKYPCFVVVPQCPSNDQWVNTPWGNGSYNYGSVTLSNSLRRAFKLLKKLENNYSIDTTRLYVTGLSMGGYGAWYCMMKYPKMFAAAVPICGAGDPSKAPLIKNVPVRFFHSSDDGTVPVSGSRDMNNALKSAGAVDAVYKEYTGLGHFSWTAAYKEPTLLPWMFSKGLLPTDVTNIQKSPEYEVYPNPFTDFIKIRMNSGADAQIIITDTSGKQLSKSKIAPGVNETTVNLMSLPKGIYVVSIINNKSESRRIVVKE
jgi:predicted peptidase